MFSSRLFLKIAHFFYIFVPSLFIHRSWSGRLIYKQLLSHSTNSFSVYSHKKADQHNEIFAELPYSATFFLQPSKRIQFFFGECVRWPIQKLIYVVLQFIFIFHSFCISFFFSCCIYSFFVASLTFLFMQQSERMQYCGVPNELKVSLQLDSSHLFLCAGEGVKELPRIQRKCIDHRKRQPV